MVCAGRAARAHVKRRRDRAVDEARYARAGLPRARGHWQIKAPRSRGVPGAAANGSDKLRSRMNYTVQRAAPGAFAAVAWAQLRLVVPRMRGAAAPLPVAEDSDSVGEPKVSA